LIQCIIHAQDIATYEQMQETMALLKMLASANRQIQKRKVVPAKVAIKRPRNAAIFRHFYHGDCSARDGRDVT
jgi:hypothetical protein